MIFLWVIYADSYELANGGFWDGEITLIWVVNDGFSTKWLFLKYGELGSKS